MADESVPVIFIDPESVSEILKTSHSYQMRKNAGAEPKIGNWDYSWKELQIDTGLVVATKHKKPFLTGREYNLYIKNNFGGIRHFAKRRVDIDTLRIRIAENIIAGKIVLLDTPKVDVKIASTLVHEFVRRRMFSESFTMKNIDAGTVSAYMEKLYQRYQTLNEDAIAKLKTKLKEETNNPMDDYLGVLLQMKGKTAVLKKKIYDTIRNETVYKWMKTNGFKGTFDEGKAMLVAEKYRKHIEDKIEQNDIQLTLN
jgi:hypothetical protein